MIAHAGAAGAGTGWKSECRRGCSMPRKCLARCCSPRLKLCLSQVAPLRKVPDASCPSASGIVPVPSRPCLSQIAQCACPKLPHVPVPSCPVPRKCLAHRASPRLELCLSQVDRACHKSLNVPVPSCPMCLTQVAVPSCPVPRKCLAHRSSPRLELCLSQVGRSLSQIDPPNRRMCLSQIAQCACPKLPCACRCD